MLIDKIPQEVLIKYMNWEITSNELSALTGFHAASLRRAIKRQRRPSNSKNKTQMINARKAFRKSIAHLPAKEIVKQANVSLATANRIKKFYGTVKARKPREPGAAPPSPPVQKMVCPPSYPVVQAPKPPKTPKPAKASTKTVEKPVPVSEEVVKKIEDIANNPKALENLDIDKFFDNMPSETLLEDLSLDKGEGE